MYPKEMIFKMPHFEVKYINEKDWKNVSEITFLSSLQDTFARISPILSEMFQGKEIMTPSVKYRIKN